MENKITIYDWIMLLVSMGGSMFLLGVGLSVGSEFAIKLQLNNGQQVLIFLVTLFLIWFGTLVWNVFNGVTDIKRRLKKVEEQINPKTGNKE